MSKVTKVNKISDQKVMGKEPMITENSNRIDILNAMNWYNYFYTNTDAKEFYLTYIKSNKTDKVLIEKISKLPQHMFSSVGWYARMLNQGGKLPNENMASFQNKQTGLMNVLVEDVMSDSSANTNDQVVESTTLSVQDKIRNKAMSLSGELEGEIDTFLEGKKSTFDLKNWFVKNDIKPQVGKIIAERFKPRYDETFDALQGKDEELKYAYRNWNKPILKAFNEFLKDIVGLAEERESIAKMQRKPRQKKEKPAGVLAKKMKYMIESEEYGVKSVNPSDIIKAEQVWAFDTKTRNLFVFNAMGPSGLSIKGTKITGFDDKTSFGKKIRKPNEIIKEVLNGGKVKLRKILTDIRAKEKKSTGRITESFILLRVI